MSQKSLVMEGGQQQAVLFHGIPLGGIVPFAGWQIPDGYLWCAGGTLSASLAGGYQRLAGTLGGTYGVSNGVNCSVSNGSSTVTTTGAAHGLAVGDIVFCGDAAIRFTVTMSDYPGLFTHQVVPLYVVSVPTSTTFTVSLTEGGTALVFTSTSGTVSWTKSFNVPDLRGRVIAGRDDLGGSAASRLTTATGGFGNAIQSGSVGGTENHLLLSSESGVPAHTHVYQDRWQDTANNVYANGTVNRPHSSTDTARTTSANSAANAANAHPNCQPTMVCNFIIRAKP